MTRTRMFGTLLAALAMLLDEGDAQDAKVRVPVPVNGEPWVGQRVTLVVELLAPGFFAGAAAFDLPDVPGVLLVPPSEHPTVSSEAMDGTSYTVQRHELSAFARRAGEIIIPAFTVRFPFKRQPLGQEIVSATVKTEPLKFTVRVPPGAEKLGSVISARNLTAVEAWQSEPGKAKVGDAFTRTITFAAPDVPAMAFPPFPTGKIDGLGIYPKAPEVLDHSERGSFSGKRRDTVVYLCQRPGQFVIPGARLTWFDLDAQQLRTIDFPARTVDVAPNPAQPSADGTAAKTATQHPIAGWTIFTAIAVSGLLLLAVMGRIPLGRVVLGLLAPLRPVHLQPLNPVPLPDRGEAQNVP